MGDPSTEACQLNCVVNFIDDTVCVGNCALSVLEVFTNYVAFFSNFCKTLVIITSRNQNALNQSTYLLSGPCFLPPVSDDFIFFPTCAKKWDFKSQKSTCIFSESLKSPNNL